MTQAQHPMFEGRRIEVGDTALVRVVIDKLFPGHPNKLVQACLSSGSAILVDGADIASLTPAPRPLVPGPAEYINSRDRLRVTVVAVHNGQAWVKMPDGVLVTEIHPDRLRNTEGASS